MPKFSIVIPVYNVVSYLRECLDSILAQTVTDWECICIDDGSTDGSGEILDRYRMRDDRFVVVHKANAGVSAARNDGISLARGEWIHFVDADDKIESSLYANLSGFADQSHEAQLIAFGVLKLDRGNRIAQKWGAGCPAAEMTGDQLLGDDRYCVFQGCVWNKIYSREVLQRFGLLFNVKMPYSEDNLFNMMFLTYCRKVIVRPEIFGYYYRAVPDSCVHTLTMEKLLFTIDQFLHLYARWQEIRTPGLERKLVNLARNLLFLGKQFSPRLRHDSIKALVRDGAFHDTVVTYLLRHGMVKDRLFSMVYCLMPQWIRRLLLELI